MLRIPVIKGYVPEKTPQSTEHAELTKGWLRVGPLFDTEDTEHLGLDRGLNTNVDVTVDRAEIVRTDYGDGFPRATDWMQFTGIIELDNGVTYKANGSFSRSGNYPTMIDLEPIDAPWW